MKKPLRIAVCLLIFFIPLVLALPYPPPPFHVVKITANLNNFSTSTTPEVTSPQSNRFSFPTNSAAIGASVLSRILGIETDFMPGYICFTNTSEIFSGEDERVDRSELIDDKQGGAIAVRLILDEVAKEIYLPFAETKCEYPRTEKGFAELDNRAQVRPFAPIGKPELLVRNEQLGMTFKEYPGLTTVFKLEGEKGYRWRWGIYAKNASLFLIGELIVLSSFLQVYFWIFPKYRKRNPEG